MKVTVTQEHIDVGEPNSPSYCPIALAILQSNKAISVGVGTKTVGISNNNQTHAIYKLPPEAIGFIRKFDRGLAVEPFEFEMEKFI